MMMFDTYNIVFPCTILKYIMLNYSKIMTQNIPRIIQFIFIQIFK
jgi:hypothetical protein